MVHEKIFGIIKSNLYITSKNNTAQLYVTLVWAKLHWNFSSWLKDVPDIHKFLSVHVVVENL